MTEPERAIDAHPDYFWGHDNRECGDHRTVGPHRAWCFDCSEWCYPTSPCARCELPQLRERLEAAEAVIAACRAWGPYTPRRVTRALTDYDQAIARARGNQP